MLCQCAPEHITGIVIVTLLLFKWLLSGHARCRPPPLPTYNPRHLMVWPCHKWRGDEESRHGATPRHCYYKEKEHGWPHSQTAERKTSPYSNVLGARRRQKEEGEAKEDMAKHFQRRPGRHGCQLAWSPPDRQWPWEMETSHRPMLREEQADLSKSCRQLTTMGDTCSITDTGWWMSFLKVTRKRARQNTNFKSPYMTLFSPTGLSLQTPFHFVGSHLDCLHSSFHKVLSNVQLKVSSKLQTSLEEFKGLTIL